jgi:hypothetical protein
VVGEPNSERAAAGSWGRRTAGLAQLSAQTRTNPGIGERGARGGIDGGSRNRAAIAIAIPGAGADRELDM